MERYGEVVNLSKQSIPKSKAKDQPIYSDSLIIDDNTVYEIDLECLQKRNERNKK